MLSRTKRSFGYGRLATARANRGFITAAIAGLVVLASGTVIACSDGVVEPSTFPDATAARTPTTLGPLTETTAGAYHNAFLDFSYPRLHKAVSKGADHKQACRVIAQAMRDFILAYRLDADPRSVGDDIAGTRCSASGRNGATFSLADDGTTSPEFNAMTAEMEYAVEIGQSVGELTPLFDQKVAYARANFPEAESDVIAAAASVGLSSVAYWDVNYIPQLEELRAAMEAEAYNRIPIDVPGFTGLIAPPAPRFSWRSAAARVGLADLKGAVHGGISGSRGGWQGALAGAVIEGGAKSAGALLGELFR